MANLLQTGAAWLGAQLRTHAGRRVSIYQGSTRLACLFGWVSLIEYEVIDANGFLMKVKSYDWSFLAEDLLAAGCPLDVKAGTIVAEMISNKEQRYEAMPMGKKPCFEYRDSGNRILTIHTKKVATDA